MSKRSKARRNLRMAANVENEKPQSKKSMEERFREIQHFFKEPHNSQGLHPPFTWDNLDAQVQEMEDLERYGHLGCEYTGLCK